MNLIRRYRRPLAWALAIVVLIFLVRVLVDSASELQRYPITVEPIMLVLSFAALSVPLLLAVPLWLWGLRWLGASLALPDAGNDTRQLVKYALLALTRLYRPGYRYNKAGVMLGASPHRPK